MARTLACIHELLCQRSQPGASARQARGTFCGTSRAPMSVHKSREPGVVSQPLSSDCTSGRNELFADLARRLSSELEKAMLRVTHAIRIGWKRSRATEELLHPLVVGQQPRFHLSHGDSKHELIGSSIVANPSSDEQRRTPGLVQIGQKKDGLNIAGDLAPTLHP